jgi:5-methylcytosine-specific restriction endonuclease McrA
MSKFANFQVSDLEQKQEDYYQLTKQSSPGGPLDKSTIAFIKSVVMRHGWLRSSLRSSIITKARISRGVYECFCCKGQFKAVELSVDHLYQRQGFSGQEVSFEQWLRNTFCSPDNLKAICKNCHNVRTQRDRREKV